MRYLLLVVASGCGGGTSGEPIMGDVTLTYGSAMPKMVVGSAVQHEDTPNNMLVQIGSDNVDCDTYLDVFLDFDAPSGSFIYFDVPKATTTATVTTGVSVQKSSKNSTAVNTGSGMVTITGFDTRVVGTVAFTTTDEEVGTITVAGSFDVKRCF